MGYRRKSHLHSSRQRISSTDSHDRSFLHCPSSDLKIPDRRIPAITLAYRSEFEDELLLSHTAFVGRSAADQESESYYPDRYGAGAEEGDLDYEWRTGFEVRHD